MSNRQADPDPPFVLAVGSEHAPYTATGVTASLTAELARHGIRCEHADDGLSAVTAFQRLAPDVVFVDVPTDDMDGPEVCRALTGLDGGAGVPIIVALDPADDASLQRAFDAGAADVIARGSLAAFVAQRLRFVLRVASGFIADDGHSHFARATGFADRAQFVDRLAYALDQARLEDGAIGVLCLEIDRFRELAYGLPRDTVDELLVHVARRLQDAIRHSDVLADLSENPDRASFARIGGGEFAVLLRGLVRGEDAAMVGRRLVDELDQPIVVGGREINVSTSVGISSYPAEKGTPEELLGFAQTAAYCAKQEGRGTVEFYQSGMNARAFERLSLESSLRHALERNEFMLYYQPRVEIATGKLLAFEALIRWQHPELGLVSPAQFIPLAEETGLIVPIGEWVLRTACAQNREWQDAGLSPVAVSVNLSSAQFRHPDLYDTVVRTLKETRLEAEWLELELTESLLMQNAEAVVRTLKRFRDTGIHLSIDDFGTGYSSLSYLKRFPINALKIDQSFIREVTTNADDAALATSIILMGRSLKLRVVAEGVETESQLSFLRIMQCDEVQGYLFSPPVPAEDAVKFLREGLPRSSSAA